MLRLLKMRCVLAFYALKMFTELVLGAECVVSSFILIEDTESITAFLLPSLLLVSRSLILPLFSELLKRKNCKACFPLGLFPPVSSSDIAFRFEGVGFFQVCKAIHS